MTYLSKRHGKSFRLHWFRVIGALILREAISRYGHENLGFFWIIVEPLLFTCGIMLLWSLTHMSHGTGVDVIPFALTGYSYITLWRHITGRSLRAINQHAILLYYKNVRIIDAVIAMAALELAGCFCSFLVAYIPLALLGFCPVMSDPLILILGYVLAAFFSLGFGLLLAGLAGTNHIIGHIVPAFMYLTMPIVGVFTMQEWLPSGTRYWLSWSPLVNGIEMFRGGLFPAEVQTYWDFPYLLISTTLSLVIGYVVFSKAQTLREV